MPTRPRSDLRAGLFIAVSIGLIFGAIVAIKGVKSVFVRETVRKVRFALSDDLGGLRIGDDVRVGGFKVGIVRSIDIVGADAATDAADRKPYILIRFTMPERYPLGVDAHVFVQSTLTGTTDLNFDSLGAGQPLPADAELAGHPSDFASVLAELGAAAPDLRQIVATVRTSTLPHIDAATAKLPDTLASFRATADHTTAAVDTAGSIFGDTKPDVRGTMANLHQITDQAKGRLPELLDRATGLIAQATTTIDDARGVMGDVRATAANAKQLTASARDLVVGNKAKLDGTIAGLKLTGDNLKEATAEIRRNPWRLLYTPGPGEMDNLELYDAARQFAEGANHVDDAALALRDALHNPDVSRDQVAKLVDRLTDATSHFHGVEQKLWASVKQ